MIVDLLKSQLFRQIYGSFISAFYPAVKIDGASLGRFPDNPLAGRREMELSEIISQPFLLTEKDASYRFILEQYLASLQKEIRPFLEIGNTDFIIRLLRQGGGVSLLPEFTVREDIREGRLVSLSPTDFHMRTWRQMVYHKEKWVTREMAAFIELVREREQGS